jgi:hypothetical protein
MPPTTQVVSIVTGSVALFIVGLDSIPALQSITDRICRKSPPAEEHTLAKTAYRDEDGEASEESLRAFSDKWQRIAIAFFSATGSLSTLGLAVFTTFEYGEVLILNWLQFGIWVCRDRYENGQEFLANYVYHLIDMQSRFCSPSKLLLSSQNPGQFDDLTWGNMLLSVVLLRSPSPG